ncbi:MAG: acyl carrier protein [Oscillospiraceae bacterium]|nr:acyl carrier protein [Oscillospiraceae bacterium]
MVLDKIKSILSSQFGIDEDQITENTDVVNDLGADSLDVVEMMMSVEDEFGLMIEDEEIAEMKTVGDVVNYIESHLG